MEPRKLSPKSRRILAAMAQGRSHDQILAGEPDLTSGDIFNAAAEALAIADAADPTYEERLGEIHQLHPRAYERWSDEEDAQLNQLFGAGKKTKEIAEMLKRQPSAIASRLAKLRLR